MTPYFNRTYNIKTVFRMESPLPHPARCCMLHAIEYSLSRHNKLLYRMSDIEEIVVEYSDSSRVYFNISYYLPDDEVLKLVVRKDILNASFAVDMSGDPARRGSYRIRKNHSLFWSLR